MITKNLTLWLGKQEKQLFVPVSQYDDMWQFVFSIVNDSMPWSIPDTAQVTLNGIKPDGNVFVCYGTVADGVATVDCTNQMTAVAGLVECELSILDASKVVGTANFFLAVEQAPKADDAVVSESTLSAYGEVLDEISQYAAGFIPVGVKTALLNCFSHVAWIDEHGQDYYDALATALAQKEVVSISAVFTQGAAVIYTNDSLDSLKQYLVVTATFDDTSTADVTSATTLSGSLTEGSSTIIVTYGGQTDTFTVTVTSALDRVAYGVLTYRDIFVTNNLCNKISDFETAFTMSTTEQSLGDGWYVKSNAGSPVVTTDAANTPTHSLKAFGSTSTQILYINREQVFSAGKYIVCASIKTTRYTKGNCGLQAGFPYSTGANNVQAKNNTVGSQFQRVVESITLNDSMMGCAAYVGTMQSANADCYVDDIVVSPVPSGMTDAEALELYGNYLTIRGVA